jgi:DNA polymerase-3 subunit epsilon
MGLDFVAVDFEIANPDLSSACAIGLAFVRDGHLADSTSYLIRPPSRRFVFTRVHRLTWKDVRDAPSFSDLWDDLRDQLSSEILVAHNATFDKAVLYECLRHYRIRYQLNPFLCSMQLSKEAFGFSRRKLDYVCRELKIVLQHHDAESDAKAAANIVIKAALRLGSADARSLLNFVANLNKVVRTMPAPRNKTKRENINLPMPHYYWAKTTKDNRPGISVRDHCLNVGCVAEALLNLLPKHLRKLLPPSVPTLAALHDVGKVSPGFLQKCPVWLGKYGFSATSAKENWALCETHHGRVTAFALRDYLNRGGTMTLGNTWHTA